jgi:serine/threonine protein phosphatase PrpC
VTGPDKIEHAFRTDVGVRRSHNQDAHAVLLAGHDEHWRDQGHVFLVADGMGAHAVGELASKMAVEIVPHIYQKHAGEGAVPALRKAFSEANASIHARGQQNREFKGMGTTTTALVLRAEGAWVAHVGDSRAYRIRQNRIEQLSFDHSLVWEMARRHKVDPEELPGVRTNVIIRSLGPDPLVEVDIEGPHPVQPGDLYLLCSDGLSGQLSDHEIGAVASVLPPAEACRFLVDLANLRGGPDNITVLLLRVADDPSCASDPAAARAVRPEPFYRRVPWQLGVLAAGVLLAMAAGALASSRLPGAEVAFTLAALAILAGIVGLAVHYLHQKNNPAAEPYRPRTRVYRQASSQVDRLLLDRLARAESALRQRARDQHWDVDWDAQERHEEEAEKNLTMGDLTAAFREYCRAMQPLTAALERQRKKEEAFQPLWDKTVE